MRIATPASRFTVLLTLVASTALTSGVDRALAEETAPLADWFSQVEEQIAAEEYHVSWQPRSYLADLGESWQAPNRAHGFRTYFSPVGPRVIPRDETEPSWEWVPT